MRRESTGDLALSKILCGANPFYGHSHFSEARNAEYLSRFDDEVSEVVELADKLFS